MPLKQQRSNMQEAEYSIDIPLFVLRDLSKASRLVLNLLQCCESMGWRQQFRGSICRAVYG